jgi:hypothetical protein
MPRFLQREIDKRSAYIDAIVDRTRAQIDEDLTPQQDHRGVYLSVARPKNNQQTEIMAERPTVLRQSRLSFSIPTKFIAGRRRSVDVRWQVRHI